MKLKKRNILSVLITVVILFALNKLWLEFKPMEVVINASGSSSGSIEVQLNKKADNKFKKYKSDAKKINFQNKTDTVFEVERSKNPKAIRLRVFLPYAKNYSPITINKIKIGKKYEIKNIKDVDIQGAEIINTNNFLTIKPLDNTIIITFNETFSEFSDINFDFKLFIIISVLGFLIINKLFDYIGDYNSEKGKDVSDLIFLTLFFAFLFIPLSNINNEEISQKENRTLAKWKPIIGENDEINYNFGNDFNNWFNDRFNMRNSFIKLHNSFLSLFFKDYWENNNLIYNKKYDFAFNKGLNSQNVFLRKEAFSKQELDNIYQSFDKLEKYCRKNNVKLYLILSNDKESIYPEYYPNYYTPEKNEAQIEQVIKTLSKNKNLEIISTKENIIKTKKENVIFEPYDTHYNGLGAYIEYKTIIEKTKNTFSNIKLLSLNDIEIVKSNVLCDTIPPEKYINEKNQYLETIKIKNPSSSLAVNSTSFYINKKADNHIKAVIIGDSFHTKYLNLLSEAFYNTKSGFIGGGDDFILSEETKKSLFNEVPDILYIETSERFLKRLKNLNSFYDIFESKYRSN